MPVYMTRARRLNLRKRVRSGAMKWRLSELLRFGLLVLYILPRVVATFAPRSSINIFLEKVSNLFTNPRR